MTAKLLLDHLVVIVDDLDAAAEPFERLGFVVTPRTEHPGAGTANRVFFLGGPAGLFYVELIAVHDRAAASASRASAYVPILDAGGGVARLMFAVDGLDEVVNRLEAEGVPSLRREVFRADGSKIADTALPSAEDLAGFRFGLVHYVLDEAKRYASRRARGFLDHTFPAKRLDHVAVIPAAPTDTNMFWTQVMGLEVAGTVTTPTMTIRQLQAGDAILELLAPSGPESPLVARPKGLIPMIAIEVADVQAAVDYVRGLDFEVTDPADGVLPGTRTATIPDGETGGLALQLLQYF